jgi:hypothetical protein
MYVRNDENVIVFSSVCFINSIYTGFTKRTIHKRFIPAFAKNSPASGQRKESVSGEK